MELIIATLFAHMPLRQYIFAIAYKQPEQPIQLGPYRIHKL